MVNHGCMCVSFPSVGQRMNWPRYRRMTSAHENICVFCESVFLPCVYNKCLWSDSETRSNSAEVCRSSELTAGVWCEIDECFVFYSAAQNNCPLIGWEKPFRWITPSQLDSNTSWPVKRCFLLIEGAGERKSVYNLPAFSWTSLPLYKHIVLQTVTWKHYYWLFMFQE